MWLVFQLHIMFMYSLYCLLIKITTEMVSTSCHTIPVILKMSIMKAEQYDFKIYNCECNNEK